MGQLAGHSAVHALNGKNIAILDGRTAFGQGMVNELIKGVQAAGRKIVDRKFTTDKAIDFKSQLARPKSFSPVVKSASPGISGHMAYMPNGDMKDPTAALSKGAGGKWFPASR